MKPLYDFGISQEDPQTEKRLLDLRTGDRILSVASGGEVPLTLLSLTDGIKITAADISPAQIMLCRLKLAAALNLTFPENGRFLGYSVMKGSERERLFHDLLSPRLSEDERRFWINNIRYVENGVAGSGRFEGYIRKLRYVAVPVIGKKNLISLISSEYPAEQAEIFKNRIATRKSLQMIFKVAFHPSIYRKRGLQDQALIHARKDTGERFYGRFKDYCTATPAGSNYFLQYFLTGKCITESSFPEYLKPENRSRLSSNLHNLELLTCSFRKALTDKAPGYFNRIHLSNLGDWLDTDAFMETLALLKQNCNRGTLICYRYLHKDHFAGKDYPGFIIDRSVSEDAQKKDRFPFYTTYLLTVR
jgi:S-adenosylmethionine-diacylglycerol 3-amino-3-carboxypropyl transferase